MVLPVRSPRAMHAAPFTIESAASWKGVRCAFGPTAADDIFFVLSGGGGDDSEEERNEL